MKDSFVKHIGFFIQKREKAFLYRINRKWKKLSK